MEKLRQFFESPPGKIAATVVVLAGIGVLAWNIAGFGGTDLGNLASGRVFICSETGETFRYEVSVGDTFPVESPHSGKKTGYEAETCYWTEDGSTKEEPTYVLLNDTIGEDGPTFCPDCSRLVVGLNPHPADARRTPPTRDEFESR